MSFWKRTNKKKEDEEVNLNKIKTQVMKGGIEMAKIEEVEDDDFDIPSDDDLEEQEVADVKPKKFIPKARPPQIPKRPLPVQPEEPVAQNQQRFEVFRQQAAEGLIDRVTGKPIAIDLWGALEIIFNKLENIERAIGQ